MHKYIFYIGILILKHVFISYILKERCMLINLNIRLYAYLYYEYRVPCQDANRIN